MRPPLEEIIKRYFYKQVEIIVAESGARFVGYLVGIRLPAGEMVTLQLVENKHIEKYIKHLNPRWHFPMAYEFIKEIRIIENASQDTEDRLYVAVVKAQEKE